MKSFAMLLLSLNFMPLPTRFTFFALLSFQLVPNSCFDAVVTSKVQHGD